jgi:hypothetical protein
MQNSKKTRSFKIPLSLENDIARKVVKDGYGLRGRSKWICDSIENFFKIDDKDFILECISYADDLEKLDKSISFRPTPLVDELISKWVITVRQKMPVLEGVKSKIIRTAIIHAILGTFVTIKEHANATV